MCVLLQVMFVQVGYDVMVVLDGEVGFDMVVMVLYDLVLIDQNMLCKNGFEVIVVLCKLIVYVDMLIFVLMIEGSDVFKDVVCDVGVIGWIEKLIDLGVLVELVVMLFELVVF